MAATSLRLFGRIAPVLFSGKILLGVCVGSNDVGLACGNLRDTLKAIRWAQLIGAYEVGVRHIDGHSWRCGLR